MKIARFPCDHSQLATQESPGVYGGFEEAIRREPERTDYRPIYNKSAGIGPLLCY